MKLRVMSAAVGLACLCAAVASSADDLQRRTYLGVALGPTDEQRGVEIRQVFPESAAFYAGIHDGDVLQKIGTVQLLGPGAVKQAAKTLSTQHPGESVLLTITKGTYTTYTVVEMPELPRESNPAFETVYDAVDVDGTLHRAIITKPAGTGPFPAVFFIQGLGCDSVEAPLNPDDPIRQLMNGFTNAGYVTFRIEKRGVGDSRGAPCSELDFVTERAGYAHGLAHLKQLPYVYDQKVFLFGHSMGGVFAPLIAADDPVAGVVVYGTIAAPLHEYFEVNETRQMKLRGMSNEHVEDSLEPVRRFDKLFLTQRKTPGEIMESDPDLRPFIAVRQGDATHLFTRHYTFWQQLDDIHLPKPWESVDVPVLAIWGGSDFPATRADHAALVSIVNEKHPGTATFLEIPHAGHGFEVAENMEESLQNHMKGPFNQAVVDETVKWLNTR